MLNVTQYLEQLFASGIEPGDLPVIQPMFQHRIWQQMTPGDGPGRLAGVVEQLRREDGRFHMEGGSWTLEVDVVGTEGHRPLPAVNGPDRLSGPGACRAEP
jgi:hypothetical protein